MLILCSFKTKMPSSSSCFFFFPVFFQYLSPLYPHSERSGCCARLNKLVTTFEFRHKSVLQAALNAAAGPHPTYVTKCSSTSHCGRSAGKHVLSLCATFLSGPLNAVTTRNVRHLPFLQYLTNGRGWFPQPE